MGPDDADHLRLIGPNQWPSAQPELRDIVLRWQAEALRVSREVLRALAAALGQDEGYFDPWFDEEAAVYVKIVHYPPRAAREADQGVGAHKDYGYLALLQQDEAGEMLEIATQGYLKATQHRVVSPQSGVDRYSIPFFLGPRFDAVVEPLHLPAELAARSRGVTDDPNNPLLAAYGDNAVVGWLRSHPRVAERNAMSYVLSRSARTKVTRATTASVSGEGRAPLPPVGRDALASYASVLDKLGLTGKADKIRKVIAASATIQDVYQALVDRTGPQT